MNVIARNRLPWSRIIHITLAGVDANRADRSFGICQHRPAHIKAGVEVAVESGIAITEIGLRIIGVDIRRLRKGALVRSKWLPGVKGVEGVYPVAAQHSSHQPLLLFVERKSVRNLRPNDIGIRLAVDTALAQRKIQGILRISDGRSAGEGTVNLAGIINRSTISVGKRSAEVMQRPRGKRGLQSVVLRKAGIGNRAAQIVRAIGALIAR